jgi:hypothetical protein
MTTLNTHITNIAVAVEAGIEAGEGFLSGVYCPNFMNS